MKYYLIAGEASGDLHGSNLMKSISALDAHAEFRIYGGDLMKALPNTHLVKHISEMSFMGFVEVLMNLRSIKRNLEQCKIDLLNNKPEVLILIDYPGFNLRIAEYAKSIGVKVYYYISPKIWAWNTKRVYKIIKNVDKVYSILPFEKDFYKSYNYEVEYIGNPIKDALEGYKYNPSFKEEHNIDKPILAILPGSRKMELLNILPAMLKAAENFKDYKVVVAGASNLPKSFYDQFDLGSAMLIFNETYDVLKNAEIAMVTSGTATLETALLKVPQVVCYRANALTVAIGRLLVKIKYISLVNLILDKLAVVELIQSDCTPDRISFELNKLKQGKKERETMLSSYEELLKLVGDRGASDRAAASIVHSLKK